MNVVGSNVGGIPEVIGKDDVFELDNRFVQNISNRVLYYLNHSVKQLLGEEFSWVETAKLETQVYDDILK